MGQDIVERLRQFACESRDEALRVAAADEIERLRAEIKRLRSLCGCADVGPSFREVTKDLPRNEPPAAA